MEDVDGVVISYSNIRFLQKMGRIMYDCPFLHIDITAQFISFSPKVGSSLGFTATVTLISQCIVGVVNKQSPDHVGLLIYDIFNGSIPSHHLTAKYEWSYESDCWIDKSTNDLVDAGTAMSFLVTGYVHVCFDFTSLGSIRNEDYSASQGLCSTKCQNHTPPTPPLYHQLVKNFAIN